MKTVYGRYIYIGNYSGTLIIGRAAFLLRDLKFPHICVILITFKSCLTLEPVQYLFPLTALKILAIRQYAFEFFFIINKIILENLHKKY